MHPNLQMVKTAALGPSKNPIKQFRHFSMQRGRIKGIRKKAHVVKELLKARRLLNSELRKGMLSEWSGDIFQIPGPIGLLKRGLTLVIHSKEG